MQDHHASPSIHQHLILPFFLLSHPLCPLRYVTTNLFAAFCDPFASRVLPFHSNPLFPAPPHLFTVPRSPSPQQPGLSPASFTPVVLCVLIAASMLCYATVCLLLLTTNDTVLLPEFSATRPIQQAAVVRLPNDDPIKARPLFKHGNMKARPQRKKHAWKQIDPVRASLTSQRVSPAAVSFFISSTS